MPPVKLCTVGVSSVSPLFVYAVVAACAAASVQSCCMQGCQVFCACTSAALQMPAFVLDKYCIARSAMQRIVLSEYQYCSGNASMNMNNVLALPP